MAVIGPHNNLKAREAGNKSDDDSDSELGEHVKVELIGFYFLEGVHLFILELSGLVPIFRVTQQHDHDSTTTIIIKTAQDPKIVGICSQFHVKDAAESRAKVDALRITAVDRQSRLLG